MAASSFGKAKQPLIPNINRILKILDPIIFPIAISSLFFMIAAIEVTSSGNEVPAAIIVNLITFLLIFNVSAMNTAELTTISPPDIVNQV